MSVFETVGAHRFVGRLMIAVTLLVLAATAAAGWLGQAERDFVTGADRQQSLRVVMKAVAEHQAATGELPTSTGELLDFMDGTRGLLAAGDQAAVTEQRRELAAARIGTTSDGVWCVVVVQPRPSVLVLVPGTPVQESTTVVLGAPGSRERCLSGRASEEADEQADPLTGPRGMAAAPGARGIAAAPGARGIAAAPGTRGIATDPGTRGIATDPGTRGIAAAPATRGMATTGAAHPHRRLTAHEHRS